MAPPFLSFQNPEPKEKKGEDSGFLTAPEVLLSAVHQRLSSQTGGVNFPLPVTTHSHSYTFSLFSFVQINAGLFPDRFLLVSPVIIHVLCRYHEES